MGTTDSICVLHGLVNQMINDNKHLNCDLSKTFVFDILSIYRYIDEN